MAKKLTRRRDEILAEIEEVARVVKQRQGGIARAEQEVKEGKETLMGDLTLLGEKTVQVDDGNGGLLRVTKVESDPPMVLDTLELADRLKNDPVLWRKITTRIVDQDKLKKAIDSGAISETLVKQCTHEGAARTPYVKVT